MTEPSLSGQAVPATKRSLLTLSHAMERAFDIGDPSANFPALVIGLFQRREYFDIEAPRYAAMAAAGTCVVVGFAGSTQGLPPGVHAVGFTPEDPRSKAWVLIAVKGAYASSLVAQDARDLAPGELSLESARIFHARWTFQRHQALADAQDQLASLAPDLPDPVRAVVAAAIRESRSHPVSTGEAGLAAAMDHVLNSLETSYSKSNRLRASLESVQAQAERDALTGLHNRHFLERYLGGGDRPTDLVTMLIDVDDLKKVNDTHGHAAGDAVLTAVAETLRATTRPGDVVIRWGGDEFLLLVPDLGHLDGAGYAARLARAVHASQPATAMGAPAHLGVDRSVPDPPDPAAPGSTGSGAVAIQTIRQRPRHLPHPGRQPHLSASSRTCSTGPLPGISRPAGGHYVIHRHRAKITTGQRPVALRPEQTSNQVARAIALERTARTPGRPLRGVSLPTACPRQRRLRRTSSSTGDRSGILPWLASDPRHTPMRWTRAPWPRSDYDFGL